jgi:hypothetical protein
VWDAAHPAPAGGLEYERDLLAWLTRDSGRAIGALTPRDSATLTNFRDTIGGAWHVLLGGPLRDDADITFDERTTTTFDSARLSAGLLRRAPNGSALPALIARPDRTPRGMVIWLSDDGKRGMFGTEGRFAGGVRRALDAGYAVLGVDLLQQGEFRPDGGAIDKVTLAGDRPYAGYTYGYNLPLAGERAQDVLSAIAYARSQAGSGPVLLAARGTVAAIAAGARAMAGDAVARAALDTGGFRFTSVDRIDHPDLLPGAVKYGDVPALLALSAPQALWVRDDKGDLALVRQAYTAANAAEKLRVASGEGEDAIGWLVEEAR